MDSTPILQEAVEILRKGGVILWGIGCDATNEAAVARVFEIKRRSEAKSLVLLASDLDMVAKYVKQIPSIAIDLVEVNDAPMTIIYPGAQYLAPNAVAEDGSVGIRIPLVPEEEGSEDEAPARKGAAPKGNLTAGAFCRELVRRTTSCRSPSASAPPAVPRRSSNSASTAKSRFSDRKRIWRRKRKLYSTAPRAATRVPNGWAAAPRAGNGTP